MGSSWELLSIYGASRSPRFPGSWSHRAAPCPNAACMHMRESSWVAEMPMGQVLGGFWNEEGMV